jgi:hypothetical protein
MKVMGERWETRPATGRAGVLTKYPAAKGIDALPQILSRDGT